MITANSEIPKNSLLLKNGDSFGYIDSFYAITRAKEQSNDIVKFFKLFSSSSPKWVDSLLVLRNKIVGVLGLKTPTQLTNDIQINDADLNIGAQIGIFKILDKSDNEFILGEDDKHLDFRVSLLIEKIDIEKNIRKLSITTAVKFNNSFGKIYFLPVKPIHKMIVKSTLKNICRQFDEDL